jgi:hypothetical protein
LPSAAIAQDSSTTSCAWTSLDHRGAGEVRRDRDPDRRVPRVQQQRPPRPPRPTVPPSRSTETEANCAEPANVVPDITIGASHPNPTAPRDHAERNTEPGDRDRQRTAARAPSRKVRSAMTNGSNEPIQCPA